MRTPTDLVTTREAADLLGVDPHVIHNAASRGKLTRYGTRARRTWSLAELARVYVCDPPARPVADGEHRMIQ